jgi:uncharacterized membrane protein YfcA
MPELLILFAGFAAASVTQSVSSFGFGIVAVALLPLFGIEIQRVVVLVTLVAGVNVGIGLWKVRRHVRLGRVLWLLLGVPLGIPLGLALLTAGGEWEWALRGLLGVVLIFAAVEPFLRQGPARGEQKRRWAFVTGFLSGALGGALSTGGPPVVIYYFRRHWAKEQTKAAIMLVFAGTIGLRLVAYGIDRLRGGPLLTADRLVEAALLVPVIVAASLLGERLFRAISQSAFRRAVAALIVLCGAYQLHRAVLLLP